MIEFVSAECPAEITVLFSNCDLLGACAYGCMERFESSDKNPRYPSRAALAQ